MPSRCLDEPAEGAPGSVVLSRRDRPLYEKRARWLVTRKGSTQQKREVDPCSVCQKLLDYLLRSLRLSDRRWRQSDRGSVVTLCSQGSAVLCRVGKHCDTLAASV